MDSPRNAADYAPTANSNNSESSAKAKDKMLQIPKVEKKERRSRAPSGLEVIQDFAAEMSTKATELSAKATAKAYEISDNLFGHMLTAEAASPTMNRRRAMGLVDVVVDRPSADRLKKRWVLVAAMVTFCYLRFALPAVASWGASHWERSVDANEFAETEGGHNSRVHFGVLVMISLGYLSMLHCSSRLMEARQPVQSSFFEILVVYNMAQMLLNMYVCVQLVREAWLLGFSYPWGNVFVHTQESHRLGFYIWLHYHCCQLELLDTVFVVLRKKLQKITFLHVWMRLVNIWFSFIACRYVCGGDTYFPAAVNAATRAAVYGFYTLSVLSLRGVPFMRKARVIEVQMFQFAICTSHALFCLYRYWDYFPANNILRATLMLYFGVMAFGLFIYTDFHTQVEGKPARKRDEQRKISIAFDSSGWLYAYHFGVASWVREHFLPEDLTPENADEKFPSHLSFSGASGGAIVTAVISTGLEPRAVFEDILTVRPDCARNPCKAFPSAEAMLRKWMPKNAARSLSARARVLITRCSLKYPFFTAEVVTSFKDWHDCFHALRASCHVPLLAGIGPYSYDGRLYVDGLFWPQMLVPWKGSDDDFVIRVSALLPGPNSDMAAPFPPTWWALIPPKEDVLRGLYWRGYQDAARFFTRAEDPSPSFTCGSPVSSEGLRRRRASKPGAAQDGEGEEHEDRMSEIQKLMLKKPNGLKLPEVDAYTGKSPEELMTILEASMTRERRVVGTVSFLVSLSLACWVLVGWL